MHRNSKYIRNLTSMRNKEPVFFYFIFVDCIKKYAILTTNDCLWFLRQTITRNGMIDTSYIYAAIVAFACFAWLSGNKDSKLPAKPNSCDADSCLNSSLK